MFGKTRLGIAYYTCQPARQSPDRHRGSLWVHEGHLLDGVHHFFAHHIFGTHRRALLADALRSIDAHAEHDRRDRITALYRTIADLDTRKKRLIRSLELADDEDGELNRDVKTRLAEIRVERATKHDELADLKAQPVAVPSPHLLDLLPVGAHQLARLPEPALRRLFEAFRLEIHYDRHTNVARCRVTLTAETQPAIQAVTDTETVKPLDQSPGQQRPTSVPFCGVPPAGDATEGNSPKQPVCQLVIDAESQKRVEVPPDQPSQLHPCRVDALRVPNDAIAIEEPDRPRRLLPLRQRGARPCRAIGIRTGTR